MPKGYNIENAPRGDWTGRPGMVSTALASWPHSPLLPSSKASRSASFRRFTWTIETLELQYIIVYKIKWVLELKYGRPESMDFWSILQSTGVSGLWNHSTVDHCQWVQSYTVDQSQWALGLKTTRVNGSGAILQQINNEIKILKI